MHVATSIVDTCMLNATCKYLKEFLLLRVYYNLKNKLAAGSISGMLAIIQ